MGAHISPLTPLLPHTIADPIRTRKLLLHRKELDRLQGKSTVTGCTCVAPWRCIEGQ